MVDVRHKLPVLVNALISLSLMLVVDQAHRILEDLSLGGLSKNAVGRASHSRLGCDDVDLST